MFARLHNSRFTAARAVNIGSMQPDAFWKLVAILDECLGDAAEGSSHAPDRDTFEYARLPRCDRPCKSCKGHGYPCLESSIRDKTGRCQCQACLLQRGASSKKENKSFELMIASSESEQAQRVRRRRQEQPKGRDTEKSRRMRWS